MEGEQRDQQPQRVNEETIPLAAERVRIERLRRDTGKVVVRKTVERREEIADEPVIHEVVEVERVPVDRLVEGPVPQIRQEGNTTVVPVLEEILVTEKRLVLREEVRLTRRKVEQRQPKRVELRSEKATVERISIPAERDRGGEA